MLNIQYPIVDSTLPLRVVVASLHIRFANDRGRFAPPLITHPDGNLLEIQWRLDLVPSI